MRFTRPLSWTKGERKRGLSAKQNGRRGSMKNRKVSVSFPLRIFSRGCACDAAPATGSGAGCCDERFSVCLTPREHISRTGRPNSTESSVALTRFLIGGVAVRYVLPVMLIASCVPGIGTGDMYHGLGGKARYRELGRFCRSVAHPQSSQPHRAFAPLTP